MTRGPGTAESCSCAKCRGACRCFPGWMLPSEALAAVSAGMASRLMRDWFEPDKDLGNTERVFVLCPSSRGRGGRDAPEMTVLDAASDILGIKPWKKGRCTFFTKAGRCSIHTSGFKPLECRTALLCGPGAQSAGQANSNVAFARIWDSEEGHRALRAWTDALAAREGATALEAHADANGGQHAAQHK